MIYVCIPAHDEAETVGVLLWKIRKVMADFGRDYEILVLDDASTDDTAAVLARYDGFLPLTVLRTDAPIGYGAAVERLLREVAERAPYPKRDCAVVLQADFSEDPEDLVGLVKTLEGGADIVAGAVDGEHDGAPRSMHVVRWLAPRLLGPAQRAAPVEDLLTGLRVYRVIVLKKAFRDADGPVVTRPDRWSANVELLQALAPHARRIEEEEVAIRYDLMTRPSRFQWFRTLRDLLGLRRAEWSAGETDESRSGRAA